MHRSTDEIAAPRISSAPTARFQAPPASSPDLGVRYKPGQRRLMCCLSLIAIGIALAGCSSNRSAIVGPVIERTLVLPPLPPPADPGHVTAARGENWMRDDQPPKEPAPGRRFLNLATGEVFESPPKLAGDEARVLLSQRGVDVVATQHRDNNWT
jgi:hypothetical protein